MNAIIHPTTWRDLLPVPNEHRVQHFRRKLSAHPGYDRMTHDARIRGGVTWLDEFRSRPIPRHRALTVIT